MIKPPVQFQLFVLSYQRKNLKRHRVNSKAFRRIFKLSFVTVILFILPKSVKSTQLERYEFFKKLDNDVLVTSSAFTQARRKLLSYAFIELNQKGVVNVLYADKDYQTCLKFSLTHR